MTLMGIDGCKGGWLCVAFADGGATAFVESSIASIMARVAQPAIIAIDIPIGLPNQGPRACDVAARRLLGQPRGSSVFPAPVRAALLGQTYDEASRLHERADGRRLTRQAFGILAKVREVDVLLSSNPRLQATLREVHPELSFAIWNSGQPMKHKKSTAIGRAEREVLIERRWPGIRAAAVEQLKGASYKPDDLNDALAAVWTAERIQDRRARSFLADPLCDGHGLRMEMWA